MVFYLLLWFSPLSFGIVWFELSDFTFMNRPPHSFAADSAFTISSFAGRLFLFYTLGSSKSLNHEIYVAPEKLSLDRSVELHE